MKKLLIQGLVFCTVSVALPMTKTVEAATPNGFEAWVKSRQVKLMQNLRKRWGYNEVLDKNRIQLQQTDEKEKEYFGWDRNQDR